MTMAAARGLPTGTVTLLFTDVEGSTELLRRLGEAYGDILAEHRRLLREAVEIAGGVEVDTQGDAFFFAFPTASGAAAAAAAAQRALAAHAWPNDAAVRVRIGVHTGEPERRETGYVGLDVHRAARISAAAHGGQTVLSGATRDLLPAEFEVVDLGEHRLKDIDEPVRLYQLAGDGLDREFPPLRALHASNVPRAATPLVGREDELAALRELLHESRIVTLVGPGGAGKTRLALELGSVAPDDYPGGAYFVDLSSVRDARYVPDAIASAVGVREVPGVPAREALPRHMARIGRSLLIVDNVEHVLEAAPFLADLVRDAADATVLATSREPLHVRGERELLVGPLEVGAGVALFRDRAGAVGGDVDWSDADDAVVEAIVRRLDCLALPVELAAARTRALPPSALLARLEHALTLLTRGYADAPERHRALRATLDWSFELLSTEEQEALARLGIFVGGFDLDAASAVLAREDGEPLVSSLVEKSLVARQGAGGAGRFVVLETIREYALERLDERGLRDEAAERHARHFLEFAEVAVAGLLGEEPARWLALLAADRPNLRAAIRWALEQDDAEPALRLTASLWRFWHARGDLGEGRGWLERALARPGGTAESRARALAGAAALAAIAGDFGAAAAYAETHIGLARSIADDRQLAIGLAALANIRSETGAVDEAERLYAEAGAAATRAGDVRAAASVAGNLGHMALARGDTARAAALVTDALRRFRELGDARGVVVALVNLGYALLGEARVDEAADVETEALRLVAATGDREALSYCLDVVAGIALARGDASSALLLVVTAAAFRDEVGASMLAYERSVHEATREAAEAATGGDGTVALAGVDDAVAAALAALGAAS
ncbi:MAG: ATP-binding protein [Pseudomonadota bacterium]